MPLLCNARLCAPPTAMSVISWRPGTRTGLRWTTPRVPSPLSPQLFIPQYHTSPAVVRARPPLSALICSMLLRPGIGTGDRRVTFVPSPRFPPIPHAITEPSDLMANDDARPAAIERTAVRLGTSTGFTRKTPDPSPSWPSKFLPQAKTLPSFRSARLKVSPAATATISLRPTTRTGSLSGVLAVVVCGDPHLQTLPSDLTASAWLLPAAMSTMSVRRPTRTGIKLSAKLLLPTKPEG